MRDYSRFMRGRLIFAIALIFLFAVTLAACNSATPTPARTPTALALATLPSAPPQPAPPTIAVSPPVTATVTATVAISPTRLVTRTVAATRTPTTKPATLSGRIAYNVFAAPVPASRQLYVANVDGSNAHPILSGEAWGALSPDGSRVGFFAVPGSGLNEGVYVADSGGGNPKKLYPTPGVSGAGVCCLAWSPDSKWLVFADSPKPTQPGGLISKVQVSDGTAIALGVQGNGPAFSSDGSQIVFSGCTENTCGVQITSAGGGAAKIVTKDNGGNPRLSPKGDKIVYQSSTENRIQVFVVNADGSGKKQLTNGKGNDAQPIWSRDGGFIFWRSDQGGLGWAIFVMNADGTNPRRIISNAPADPNLWGWESLSVGL